tara:strand:+ start:13130 stop:13825 length:696 start_codon:yes stop_codon:yes gene_type:complete
MKYFISAPFGNYLQYTNFLSGKPVISVTGTFTVKPRPGLLKHIVKTLRYTRTGWRNKLGLRNPGIFVGIEQTAPNAVMSIASLEPNDWRILHEIVPKKMNIELNISCPNVDSHPNLIKNFAKDEREWCIVKVPPTITNKQLDNIVKLGYTQIHASNTVPTDKGGLSGKIIMPYTMKHIDYIKNKHPHVKVIAGGGVSSKKDAQAYVDAGADYISLGSVCFTPWKIKRIINE